MLCSGCLSATLKRGGDKGAAADLLAALLLPLGLGVNPCWSALLITLLLLLLGATVLLSLAHVVR